MDKKNALKPQERGRRRFLKEGAALAAFALGGVQTPAGRGQTRGSEPGAAPPRNDIEMSFRTRAYGERSRFETTERPPLRTGSSFNNGSPYPLLSTPLQDSMGIITPSALHYVNNHGYVPPDIDPRQHRLLIHGMVDHPVILTLEDLKGLPSVSRIHYIECNGNSSPTFTGSTPGTVEHAHGRTSCSEWTGVALSLLLQEVGVQKGARWVDAESADSIKFSRTIPIEKALHDVLVAYGQNGEAVRPEQGYPLKLLVPGWEGSYSIKWLRRLKLSEVPEMGKWSTAMYASLRPDNKKRWFQFEMGVKSIITFPSGEQRLPGPGFYEITGLAWSPGGAIRRVEVSTDGGRTWKDAELQEPILRVAHTRFRFPWNWNGEEALIQSRSTDDRGDVQPSLVEMAKLFGLTLDFLKSKGVSHFNAIYPWKVRRDGSVHNALWEV